MNLDSKWSLLSLHEFTWSFPFHSLLGKKKKNKTTKVSRLWIHVNTKSCHGRTPVQAYWAKYSVSQSKDVNYVLGTASNLSSHSLFWSTSTACDSGWKFCKLTSVFRSPASVHSFCIVAQDKKGRGLTATTCGRINITFLTHLVNPS